MITKMEDICVRNALLFKEVSKEKDVVDFARQYLKSETFLDYLKKDPLDSVLEVFEKELENLTGLPFCQAVANSSKKEEELAYWMGYLLTQWHLNCWINVQDLIKEDLEWLYCKYETYKDMSSKEIYDLFELEQILAL